MPDGASVAAVGEGCPERVGEPAHLGEWDPGALAVEVMHVLGEYGQGIMAGIDTHQADLEIQPGLRQPAAQRIEGCQGDRADIGAAAIAERQKRPMAAQAGAGEWSIGTLQLELGQWPAERPLLEPRERLGRWVQRTKEKPRPDPEDYDADQCGGSHLALAARLVCQAAAARMTVTAEGRVTPAKS